jgi:hypothetical protein
MAADTGTSAAAAAVCQIDEAYEFDAPKFFDFINEETEEAVRAAEAWFEASVSHAPSRKRLLLTDRRRSPSARPDPPSYRGSLTSFSRVPTHSVWFEDPRVEGRGQGHLPLRLRQRRGGGHEGEGPNRSRYVLLPVLNSSSSHPTISAFSIVQKDAVEEAGIAGNAGDVDG